MSSHDSGHGHGGGLDTADLPALSDETVDRIEGAVFRRIGADRTRTRRRRRGTWLAAGAAAAVVVVAAVIAPSLQTGLNPVATTSDSAEGGATAPDQPMGDDAVDLSGGSIAEDAPMDGGKSDNASTAGDRDIITTASVSVAVPDVRAAADDLSSLAEEAGGWVESLQLGTDGQQPVPLDTGSPAADAPEATYGWVSVRVPADGLQDTIDALSDLGEVTAVDVSRQDVTETTIDLRARIDSLEASVQRLTDLMAQAGSVADLIAAESALAERQAELESLQQQLESLEGQVDMSTLSVSFAKDRVAVDADPAGFGDGLLAGWNAVVATLNGIVIGLGFLLPWLLVAGVLALVIWLIVRLARRSRRRASGAESRGRGEE